MFMQRVKEWLELFAHLVGLSLYSMPFLRSGFSSFESLFCLSICRRSNGYGSKLPFTVTAMVLVQQVVQKLD